MTWVVKPIQYKSLFELGLFIQEEFKTAAMWELFDKKLKRKSAVLKK